MAAITLVAVSEAVSLQAAESVDFNRDVRPILADHCFACHGPDAATREAGLRLDQREAAFADLGGYAAVVPGSAEESELVARIEHEDPDLRMPPAEMKKPLSPSQIETLRRWIDEGANYARHWAFEPPQRPALPTVHRQEWPVNAIDRFVLARLEAEGLQPEPPASRARWLRRVTLDLTGLPPTPAATDEFLADQSPDAFRRVVDRLLASERYGETMALDWLDAARYADTDGYQNDGPRTMWPWRDWVIEAYNAGMPFDRFTIEQLAGDLLPDATLEQRVATGFNRNHRYNSEAGLVLEEFLLENAVDRVDTTSTVWMGLTMGCARCHDHKFDPVSQREYYQLVAFFDNVAESGRAVKFGNSEPWVTAPTRSQAERLAELDQAIERRRRHMNRATDRIDRALERWLADSQIDLNSQPAVPQQIEHRFSFDSPLEESLAKQLTEADGGLAAVPGVIGEAVRSDGDHRLALGKVADTRCETRFSIAFWLRPDRVDQGVILSRQTDNTRRPGLAVEMADGKLQFYIITRWVAGVGAVETQQTLEPGVWTHVTLTNDGSQSAGGMRIYLNGKPAATETLYNTNSNTGGVARGAELTFGGGVHGPGFEGAIDELRYYSRTLWGDEVERLAAEPELPEIAAMSESEGTASQQALLRSWFLDQAAPEKLRQLAERWHAARMARQRYWDQLPTTMVMQDLPQPRPTHVRRRGVYDQLGDAVDPSTPEIFPSLPEGGRQDRLALARWLVSGEHPLTARVTVNRYWQRFFGAGLVRTPGDFGLQGEPPTHPELLDWLATEFVRGGWDVKQILRTIVLSQTYRQSSRVTPEKLEADPDNRLLSRGPRMRLSAHVVRDQALEIGGLLSHRQGGPSVKTFQPAGLWAEMSNMKYELGKGEDLYRRSLYTFWKRTVAPPSLAALDAANRETCEVQIRRTNTPLQALTLLNETAFVHAAVGLAFRLLNEPDASSGGDASAAARVVRGFRLVAGRRPDASEEKILLSALRDYRDFYAGHPDQASELLAGAEAPLPLERCGDPVEVAAWTALANVLLNLDEAITKE